MKSFGKTFLIIISLSLVLAAAVLAVRLFSGPEDAWLCQNGQWVKHGNPDAPAPVTGCGENQEIYVVSPLAGQTIASPLEVSGQALGNWYFEASFPFELVDGRGKILARSFVQAQSDWMTTNLVPFKGMMNYNLAATTTGKLIFKNDNPSGLPANAKSFEVPVIISPSRIMAVKAYFNNNNFDPQISCNQVFPVTRIEPKTAAPARAALEQLLAGPTAEEKNQGYYTSLNPGVKINSLVIANGTAKVDFDETLEKAVGGSCRVSAIRAQIIATLRQFSTVKNVVISVNGRIEDILQP